MKNINHPYLFFIFLLSIHTNVWTEEINHFRYWNSNDGLGESYCSTITISTDETIWVNHGDVSFMSILDGYAVRSIPSPGSVWKVYPTTWGDIWSCDENGLLRFIDGKWISIPVREIQKYITDFQTISPYGVDLYPVSYQDVLFLLPDKLMEFNGDIQKSRIVRNATETGLVRFNRMIPSRDGGVWIAGEQKIAKAKKTDGRFDSPVLWEEYDLSSNSGFQSFRYLLEDDRNTLFLIADDSNSKRHFILFDTLHHQLKNYPIENVIRGWPSSEGCYWVVTLPTQQLCCLEKDGDLDWIDLDVLSGTIHDVALDKNDIFWIANSQNLARYTPPLWRTPPDFPESNTIVHSIIEDRRGRLWFACTGSLVCLDDSVWKKYPFPDPYRSDFNDTQCLNLFPDGRIVIQTRRRNREMLIFDPTSESFNVFEHPAGRKVRRAYSNSNGLLIVQTGEDEDFALEEFDGITFSPILNLGENWGFEHLRYIFETSKYGLWLGGTAGLGIIRDGEYKTFYDCPEYMDNGSLCIEEMKDGTIWVGGRNKIVEFNGECWTVIWDGVDKVRSMIKSNEGSVWLASGNGIHRYQNGMWMTNTNLDGLSSTIAYEIFQDSRGRIWAGTSRGVSLYYPKADGDAPETFLDSGKNVLRVSPDGDAQFLFSGIDKWKHTSQQRLLFTYRIDKGSWSPLISESIVSVTGIEPGDHVFEVRCVDRNGNLDASPASHKFTVLKVWYRESVFLGLAFIWAFLICLLVGFSIYRKIEKHRIYYQLKKNEEILRDTQKLSKIGGWEYDVLSEKTFWTDEVYRIYEVSKDINRDLFQLSLSCLQEEDRFVLLKAFQCIISTGEPYDFVFPFTTVIGNSLWIRTMARAEWINGRIYRIIGNIMDISQQKKIEMRWLQSQKMDAVANLAGGIAHNINNLLTGVIGNLVLAKKNLDPSASEKVDKAHDSANRAALLVRDLLEFSRKNVMKSKKVNVNSVVKDVLSILQGTTEGSISIELDLDDGISEIYADESQLQSVIMNLCLNARDATERLKEEKKLFLDIQEKYYITVRTSPVEFDGDSVKNNINALPGFYVLLSVSDNGSGMDRETANRLFEPFYSTKNTVGAGLGLASVFAIIERHKGWIDVETEYGQGSTFKVYFPVNPLDR